MHADGNYHDADMNIMQDDPIIQHEIRTGEYVAPHLGYHPYVGPYVTKMLMNAVRAGDYKEIMRIFQTTRVDPNAQDEDGNTALHIAHEYAMVQIICLLDVLHAASGLWPPDPNISLLQRLWCKVGHRSEVYVTVVLAGPDVLDDGWQWGFVLLTWCLADVARFQLYAIRTLGRAPPPRAPPRSAPGGNARRGRR